MKYIIENVSKRHLNNKVLQDTIFFAAVKLSAKDLFCENDTFEVFSQSSIFREGPTWFGGFYIIRDGKRIKRYFSFYNDLNLCSVEIYPNGKTLLLEHN